jgi:hypothetical protein
VAVGDYTDASKTAPLAEAWDGTRWTVIPAVNPRGSTSGYLGYVSCTSTTACIAVGGNADPLGPFNYYLTLAESWNGTRWTIQPTPNSAGANNSYFAGLSCVTRTTCTAVGTYEPTDGSSRGEPLIESLNGAHWTIQPAPAPADASLAQLNNVSCTSATACRAVGSYDIDGYEFNLAQTWNGSQWTIEPTPSPGIGNVLLDVSCLSATACSAVGYQHHGWDLSTLAISKP